MELTLNADLLENLGLTRSEIKVYLCLLDLNSASAAEIAEKAGIYRKNTYDALGRLIKKGLVSFAKVETKNMYIASEPQKLLDFLEIRKNEIQSIMPELKRIYHSMPDIEDVRVFKGKNGIKSIFEDILKEKVNYDKFGSIERFKEMLPYYYRQYQRRKQKNAIKSRAIYSESEVNEEFVKEFIGDVHFLPKTFVNPATTIIYGNKVAIIIWKENPLGVLINSKEVAESHRYYFESLWAASTDFPQVKGNPATIGGGFAPSVAGQK